MDKTPTFDEWEEIEEMKAQVADMSSRELKAEYDAIDALVVDNGWDNTLSFTQQYYLILEEAMIMDDQDVYGDDFG